MKEKNAAIFSEIDVQKQELSQLVLHFESLANEEINMPYN